MGPRIVMLAISALLIGSVNSIAAAAPGIQSFSARTSALSIAISPDGNKIAFLDTGYQDGQAVVLIDRAGQRRITGMNMNIDAFTWMPNSEGALVSYSAGRSDELAIVNLSGKVQRTVRLSKTLVISGGLTISPDGKLVLVAAQSRARRFEGATALYEVDLRTNAIKRVATGERRSIFSPRFVDAKVVLYMADDLVGHRVLVEHTLMTGTTRNLTTRKKLALFFDVSQKCRLIVLETASRRQNDVAISTLSLPTGERLTLTHATGPIAISPAGDFVIVPTGAASQHFRLDPLASCT